MTLIHCVNLGNKVLVFSKGIISPQAISLTCWTEKEQRAPRVPEWPLGGRQGSHSTHYHTSNKHTHRTVLLTLKLFLLVYFSLLFLFVFFPLSSWLISFNMAILIIFSPDEIRKLNTICLNIFSPFIYFSSLFCFFFPPSLF